MHFHEGFQGECRVPPAQRPTSSKCAQQSVLQITELLEQILQHLPWNDLFLCQSVNRHFQGVIAGSPRLQQKMFLKPRCPPLVPGPSGLEICPALQRRPNRRRKGPFRHMPQEPEIVCSIKPPGMLTADGIVGSSWSRLHLTNPPVREVWASICWKGVRDDGAWVICHYSGVQPICDPEGFTIGTILHGALHDDQGRLDVEASWLAVGQEEEFVRGYKSALEVVKKLEGVLGVKARFEEGIVRFMDAGS